MASEQLGKVIERIKSQPQNPNASLEQRRVRILRLRLDPLDYLAQLFARHIPSIFMRSLQRRLYHETGKNGLSSDRCALASGRRGSRSSEQKSGRRLVRRPRRCNQTYGMMSKQPELFSGRSNVPLVLMKSSFFTVQPVYS